MKAKIWVPAAVLMVAIAATMWWFMRRGRRVEARRRVEEAWARFERCLIGPPLVPGESARTRVRRIWLATPRRPEGLTAKAREGLWPDRCARYLDRTWSDAHASGLGDAITGPFMRASEESKTAGQPGTYASFDVLFAEVAKAGVPLGRDARVPFPALPVKPFVKADLDSLGLGFVATWARRDPSGVWRFLLDGKHLCEVDLPAATGGCDRLRFSGASDAHLELATGEPGAPPVIIVAKQGAEGVYEVLPRDAQGERPLKLLHEGGARGAHGRGPGAADVLVGDDQRGFSVLQIRNGQAVRRVPLAVSRPPELRSIAMVDGNVYFTAGRPGKPGSLVRIAPPESGPAVRQFLSLDGLPPAEWDRIRGCKNGETEAVYLETQAGPKLVVVRGKVGTWGKPHEVEAGSFPQLSCREGGVILTWGALRRVRCTRGECAADGSTLTLPDEAAGADVAERGVVASGQPLHGGRPGGVRLRVGPVDRLHDTPDHLVVDDGEDWHDGIEIAELYLFGGPDYGLLVVPELGDHHVYAFRVAPDGVVTPVKGR